MVWAFVLPPLGCFLAEGDSWLVWIYCPFSQEVLENVHVGVGLET